MSRPSRSGAISADGRTAYADVLFRQLAADVSASAKDAVHSAMRPAREAGLEVEFGGTAEAPHPDVGGPGEVIGVVVAFVVLAVALSSLVAAGLPLFTARVGVAIGTLGVEFLARFIDMTTTATVPATMIGLAVGIDSLVIPLKAVVGFPLSVAAGLRVMVWVFHYGHLGFLIGLADPAPVASFVPVLLVGVLFGLAMDYEVFLISRMKEAYERDQDATGPFSPESGAAAGWWRPPRRSWPRSSPASCSPVTRSSSPSPSHSP